MSDWRIYKGTGQPPNPQVPQSPIADLPAPPAWRQFSNTATGLTRDQQRGESFQVRQEEVDLVNAALYLRRPLLVTGNPGTGKSSLAYAVAYELGLGTVLLW